MVCGRPARVRRGDIARLLGEARLRRLEALSETTGQPLSEILMEILREVIGQAGLQVSCRPPRIGRH
jgi:hypothetical protein